MNPCFLKPTLHTAINFDVIALKNETSNIVSFKKNLNFVLFIA